MLRIYGTEFDPVTNSEISNNLSRYRAFVEYWEDVDSQNQRINNPTYQQSIIDNNTQLISTLTNPQNKLLIERYQQNSKNINEHNNFINEARNSIALFNRYISEINQRIQLLNSHTCSVIKSPLLNEDALQNPINQNIETSKTKIEELSLANNLIAEQFKLQGINQDISSLLTKVTEYQKSIDHASSKPEEINQRTQEYHKLVQSRGELLLKYKDYIEEQKNNIDNAFLKLQRKQPHWNEEQNTLVQEILSDIHINGAIVFNKEQFYSGIEECLNRGKFRSTNEKSTFDRLMETFCVNSSDDYFRLVSGENIINCDGDKINLEAFLWMQEFFNKGGRFELLNYLHSSSSIKKYLYTNADFQYKGKREFR
ncbi:hypothetical protein [Aeromonas sp. QDB25]|uniref:hypothetical protein n=1 Tax=Aeromonas sp. QDB25 TaxID=2989832 RepID=UPI0022E3F047|nr:hypothetical protein [Aeromonas sp. QDB25]